MKKWIARIVMWGSLGHLAHGMMEPQEEPLDLSPKKPNPILSSVPPGSSTLQRYTAEERRLHAQNDKTPKKKPQVLQSPESSRWPFPLSVADSYWQPSSASQGTSSFCPPYSGVSSLPQPSASFLSQQGEEGRGLRDMISSNMQILSQPGSKIHAKDDDALSFYKKAARQLKPVGWSDKRITQWMNEKLKLEPHLSHLTVSEWTKDISPLIIDLTQEEDTPPSSQNPSRTRSPWIAEKRFFACCKLQEESLQSPRISSSTGSVPCSSESFKSPLTQEWAKDSREKLGSRKETSRAHFDSRLPHALQSYQDRWEAQKFKQPGQILMGGAVRLNPSLAQQHGDLGSPSWTPNFRVGEVWHTLLAAPSPAGNLSLVRHDDSVEDLQTRRFPASEEEKKKAVLLCQQGKSNRQIAEELGRHPTTIMRWLNKEKV